MLCFSFPRAPSSPVGHQNLVFGWGRSLWKCHPFKLTRTQFPPFSVYDETIKTFYQFLLASGQSQIECIAPRTHVRTVKIVTLHYATFSSMLIQVSTWSCTTRNKHLSWRAYSRTNHFYANLDLSNADNSWRSRNAATCLKKTNNT
jgi:hypothetical protein